MKKNQTTTGKNSKKRSSCSTITDSKKRLANAGSKHLTEGEKLQRLRDYAVHFRSPWALETPTVNDAVYG